MSRPYPQRGREARAAVARGRHAAFFQIFATGLLTAALAACGGGGGGAPGEAAGTPESGAAAGTGANGTDGAQGAGQAAATTPASTSTNAPAAATLAASTTRADAFRLLTQATFGATDADVAKVMASGTAAWVDAQLALPSSSAYLARWDAMQQVALAKNPNGGTGQQPISSQFFQQAISGQDQLRSRVGYALSQVFVVSTQSLEGDRARSVASFMDMLDNDALGNYRTLLQDVAMHPAMGIYLSSLKNQKENPATGQVPDQNFAREVMQLMSIGLSRLNADGTMQRDANGAPIDTYGADDVVGLSKVFTGFSYGGADTSVQRFMGGLKVQDPNRFSLPMQPYAQFHSTSAKSFLGVTVAAQAKPDPALSLKIALDTLFNHPNVGPFIGRQLIQRLVTSHPSNAYVGRVAAAFANNGSGVRGDMRAVVRAILLDPEARNASGDAYGKVREPLLRVTAWMRAFGAKSDNGAALVASTDDPGLMLGQTAGRAASVFNFYRPGYVAPDSETGARNLTMPELQITSETSVAGYVNTMSVAVSKGFGNFGPAGTAPRRDIQPDYAAELAAASSSATLVDRVTAKLLGDGVTDAFKSQVRGAVDSIAVPALKPGNTNQAQVTAALQNRVWAAVLLTLASPEFIVQK
jgi:uncharacterized protein (DUF1800 family)